MCLHCPVDPFIAISRREIVELPSPWNGERVVMDYVEQAGAAPVDTLSEENVRELERGAEVRYELEHRLMGRIQAEMRLVVLSPQRLDVSIDGAWWLSWWLRIIALPFRGRLRRWLDRRIEELLADLSAEPADADAAAAEHTIPQRDEADSGVRWTLEILTPGGRGVYRRTSPSP